MNTRQTNWYGSNWIRREKRLAIYIRDNWRCVYCDKDLQNVRSAKNRQLDHVNPVHNGKPDNSSTNLVTCCEACNQRKNGKNLWSFVKDVARLDYIIVQRNKSIDVRAAKLILYGDA
mgnify:CR=1 FL=1